MSFGGGSSSSSATTKSSTQATNYGRDQITASTAEGDVAVEDLSDEALAEVVDFAGESNELTARSFSEMIGFTAEQAAAKDEQIDTALSTVSTIAQDKATGAQRAQRMTLYAVAGVVLTAIVFGGGRKKAA